MDILIVLDSLKLDLGQPANKSISFEILKK